jgi:exosortase/archaeosortase
MTRPYQPSLLRLLHGTTAIVVALAWLSGLLVYSLFDGRWGRLPWRLPGDWIDLHGTVGVALLPLAVLFAAYAFTLGRRQLTRASNAVALAALSLAIGTGKLMQEDWLRAGELHHLAYSLHLLAWVVMAAATLTHLTGVMRRGGLPMLRSMVSLKARKGDLPADWPEQLRCFLQGLPPPRPR